jgi:hypothetical protein
LAFSIKQNLRDDRKWVASAHEVSASAFPSRNLDRIDLSISSSSHAIF